VAVGSFFLGETYVLERSGLGSAITRSRTLGYAGFGEALAGTLVFITARCVAFGLGDVAGRSIIHDVFGFKSPITVFDEGSYSSALVFSILAIPVLSVGRFLLYIAVRTNLEGWDIQTNFTQIRIDSEARRAEALSGVTP
jgi:hypothetical protein